MNEVRVISRSNNKNIRNNTIASHDIRNKIYSYTTIALIVMVIASLYGCSKKDSRNDNRNEMKKNHITIHIAAAASMEKIMEEMIRVYEEETLGVKIEGIYDSSGKLQVQIQEGLEADIFLSAAMKQMDALVESGHIMKESVIPYLENKVVLITQKDSKHNIKTFSQVAESDSIAIGDPDSVPAGAYAKEIFSNLGNYELIQSKASIATNVTEILNWVAESSAEVGVVYKTDAISNEKVLILEEAKDGMLQTPVIYPMAIIKQSEENGLIQEFIEYLQSDNSRKLLEEAGFYVK